MKRRAVITLLGCAAAWPLAARAQQRTKLPTIGFLGANTPSAQVQLTSAFVKRLNELGWTEGRNIEIEYRWADGRSDRATEFVAEFVQRKVNVIVTHATTNVLAAKQATSAIPIVFAVAADPVGTGIVASLARPGGNVTGLSNLNPELATKRLEVLREAVPGIRRLAIMANGANPSAALDSAEVRATAVRLGLQVSTFDIRLGDDITAAFDRLKGAPTDALYVVTEPLAYTYRLRINTFALAARLPTIHGLREYVEAAGLLSYGVNLPDLFRRAGDYVDKVLRGAKPADLPVEQPTKFDLVINLTTAKALGIDVPPTLLARADEVIE